MEALLSPGKRLMRRLGVAGKFITLGVVLLIPLLVCLTGGWMAGSTDITVTARERDGARLAIPLVRLIAVLTSASGHDGPPDPVTTATITAAVTDVDAADAAVGTDLGLHDGWQHLRNQVLAGSPRALSLVRAFVQQTADNSHLTLDPQLDSYYVMIALVDRLPRLLEAAAREQERAGEPITGSNTGTGTADPMLAEASQRLRLDLSAAGSATRWQGLTRAYAASYATLGIALAPCLKSSNLASSNQASSNQAVRDLDAIAAAGAGLADRLGTALNTLLQQRQSMHARTRLQPVLLAGLALLGAGYLALSLYRTTTQDVRTVLAEITQVTCGDLNHDEPLSGRDEFAQMSRAVRETGDRLAELLGALRLQATHDEVTGLPNRAMFLSTLAGAIADQPGRCAVLLADLNRFKDVNDSFGHGMGDRLLRVVSARFRAAVGEPNLVARLGSNEFAVLIYDTVTMREVQQVAARMQVALAEPVDIEGRQLHVRARIGVALHATGNPGAVELIRNADVALSAAKSHDGTAVALFEPAMHDRTRDRTELSGDLVTAVARNQFFLVYQPIVDVTTGVLHGVEALVRWVHPTRGAVSPAVFVPLAEASGQIVELGRWVLHEALRQLAAWHREFPDHHPFTMEVNLSADQLTDPALPGTVLDRISFHQVDPRRIVLEITETALVRDMDTALRRLEQLSAIGVRLALDDFGTGYSSLSYLRRLPVNVLKVDKSFVDDIDSPDGQAARLLHDIVGLGAGLGMEVIAEGIESPGQVPVLRSAGCTLGQGYLWSRPLPAEELTELLRRGARLSPDLAGRQPPGPHAGRAANQPDRGSAGPGSGQRGQQERVSQAGPLEVRQMQ